MDIKMKAARRDSKKDVNTSHKPSSWLSTAKHPRLRIVTAAAIGVVTVNVSADLPDCAEAFGESSLAVHSGNNANLNLRDHTRVFRETGVNANSSGQNTLSQKQGSVCISDDDPTVEDPGTCDTFGAVTSWEESGRSFPEPPSNSYPNGPSLTVTSGQTTTIDFASGTPVDYKEITIKDGGHLIIDDTAISDRGEVTIKNRFTGEAGANLTLNGTPVVNVDGSFDFGDDKGNAPRSTISINGMDGDSTDTFTTGSISVVNTTVDATKGTWRPLGDGKVEITGSDINCDATHSPGTQPQDVMPECNDEDGGVFVISQSTGTIMLSEFRGYFYTDGTQFNIEDSIVQGALTGGGMSLRASDVIPGPIPTTGDFCEERVADFTFDLGTGSASTCVRREIDIVARDRFGQELKTYDDPVAISTSSNHGAWFKQDSAGDFGDRGADGSRTNVGTANDGSAEYEFVDTDEGAVSLFLENVHADNLTVTVTDMGSEGVSSTSGTLAFRDNAFVLQSIDSLGADVVAGRDHRFEVALWQRDASTGTCEVPPSYNDANQPLRLWLDRHAEDPSGVAPTGTGVSTDASATLPDSMPGSTNIQLDFSSATGAGPGRALLDLETTDVAKYALSVYEQNSGFAVDISGDALPIEGGSEDYVVRPFGLDIEVPDDDGSTGVHGNVLAKAGESFETRVRSVQWESGDDTDDDGIADNGADLSNNDRTVSFGNEGTPETVTLTPVLAAPSGGSVGTLTNTLFDDFTSGAEGHTITWNEVGYLHIEGALTDGSYIGGKNVTGRKDMVGRFIPHHFTRSGSSLINRSELPCSGATFTYIGEAFGSDFTLTAKALGGTDTTNYEGSYAHLDTAAELNFGATDGSNDLSGRLSVPNVTFSWTAGAGDIVAELVLARQTEEAPFDPLRVGIAAADDDSVTLQSSALNLDVDGDTTDDHAETAAPELRFGRLVVDNAGGAEIAPIDVPVRAEYWTGDTWQANGLDSCTTLTLADEVELDNGATTVPGDQSIALSTGSGQTRISSGDPVLSGGLATVTFSAPGAGNTGWVDMTALLGAGSPDHVYLQGDPEDDGSWSTNPKGRVTFGIYSGNDRWIDIRRVPVD